MRSAFGLWITSLRCGSMWPASSQTRLRIGWVYGLGLRFWGSGFGAAVSSRVEGLGLMCLIRFGVRSLGFRVQIFFG